MGKYKIPVSYEVLDVDFLNIIMFLLITFFMAGLGFWLPAFIFLLYRKMKRKSLLDIDRQAACDTGWEAFL